MKYRPNEGRILVKKLRKPDFIKVNTGIVIPGEGIMNRELERGEVIVGSSKIKSGQIIWFSSYSVSHLYDEQIGSFFCLAEDDVMVFEEGRVDLKERESGVGAGEEVKEDVWHPNSALQNKNVAKKI